jgi:hypothetical protein
MPTTAQTILAPTSPGEVLDRLTILQLKAKACRTSEEKATIHLSIDALTDAWRNTMGTDPKAHTHWQALHAVNSKLWRIEDRVRAFEKAQDFGPDFVQAARSVYQTNDERARIKRAVNDELGSRLVDIKFHE